MAKKNKLLKTKEKKEIPSVCFCTLYRFASKCDILLICLSIMASIVAGILLPLGITFVAEIFNVMVMYEKNQLLSKPIDKAKFLDAMHKFGLHYSLIGFATLVALYISTALIEIAAIHQVYQIKQAYLRAALYQDISYFDMHQTGDFASKMSDDILKLEDGIGQKLSTFVYYITAGVSCIILAFIKGWKLALLCLVTAPVTIILVVISAVIANRYYKQEAKESGRASAVAEEVIGSIRTVFAYNGQEKEIARYKEPLSKARRIFIKKEIFSGLALSLVQFGLFCSYGLSFYFGACLMINEPSLYDANVMFAVFFGIVHGLQYCGFGGELANIFGSATGAAAHIFHLINTKPIINPQQETGIKPSTFDGKIELKNVTFHYPARPDVTVLNGVSLTVKRGQSVALVGPSGCGKSTIIQLLVRYYDVSEGNVLVDGRDVREVSVRWLRAQIGLVGQEPVLFNTTVRENIRYGREDANDAEIEAAAKQAHVHMLILNFPKGYETLVGERGGSLSGGQKQRIAIARALVRNPSVLLLDEATSALDMVSEKDVQQTLKKATKGRTTVIVAHRLSTIRNVDLIYVMQKGIIAEKGSHEELIAKKGLYYDMVQLQKPEATASESEGRRPIDFSVQGDKSPEEENREGKEPPTISLVKALALNAPEWKFVFVGCICGLVVGFTMPFVVLAFGHLFGSLSIASPEAMFKEVIFISFICVAVGSAVGTAFFIQAVCFGIAGARLTERLRSRMFAHILHEDMAFFDNRANSTGALCAKLSAEAAHVRGATGQRISILIQMVGSVILSLGFAFAKEWRVAFIALVFVPPVLPVFYFQNLLATITANMNAKAVEKSTQLPRSGWIDGHAFPSIHFSVAVLGWINGISQMLSPYPGVFAAGMFDISQRIAVDALTNIRTVAALGREEEFVRDYRTQLAHTLPKAKRGAHLFGLVTGLSRAIFNFMNAAGLVYGGSLIASERIAYEKVLIATQCIQMSAGTVNDVFAYFPGIQKGTAAAARVLHLLARKPTILNPKEPIPYFVASGEITLEDVEFHYPNRPNISVLQQLNLQVAKGKTTALVGRSGCGKSTIIQLLLRYYDPVTGDVLLDDVKLPWLLIKDVRSCFGLVAQEPMLFDLTIAENIAYGDNARTVSHDEIIEVAKQANVHDFVTALPEGYDTNIGTKGIQLSGGQKQRVAIARAIIRKPQILLLDEATSALDTENEKVVQEALRAARAGRTCVMIAHRLSTVRDADTICVVDGGHVAERGTHEELMDLKKLYYEMQPKL